MRRLAAIVRDKINKMLTAEFEVEREAIRRITKDKSLSLNTRIKAQQLLNSYPSQMRPGHIRDRCVVNGNARSVFPEFRMNRIALRELALMGQIPGVKKARW